MRSVMRGAGCVLAALLAVACSQAGEDHARAGEDGPDTDAGPAVRVVGEGVISTDRDQTFPAEDPQRGDLWFSEIGQSFDEQTIMFAGRQDSGWLTPRIAPFSGTWGDRAPRFSPDGTAIYFTSNRPRPGATDAGDLNIWRVERRADGWGEPELVQSDVNSGGSDMHVSVTSAGIWVASSREGGRGRSDLYRVDESGSAQHLGALLNDELSQPDLWVSPDESWMVLAITDHPDGFGGDDLYVSWAEEGRWTTPVNLGPEVNSPEYEYGPWVSSDGTGLFFTSHRDGPANVYRVDLEVVHRLLESR
jgi:Tol biopolymer transport system component